ncbi:hypothetical protein EJ04DRAFT_555813 [Polyplosphaeria fusca]|uniref:Uncharacterized protein n=1 Tax=Polyplosphaeria fusca TaxID=682080 RepID=A0A9P4UZ66_9PLEO|nr:hypothetical protein EJ04DRAFT_555813 [Polyplosphaeria fusca]
MGKGADSAATCLCCPCASLLTLVLGDTPSGKYAKRLPSRPRRPLHRWEVPQKRARLPLYSSLVGVVRKLRHTSPDATVFPFLQLPRELRDMIYNYMDPAPDKYTVQTPGDAGILCMECFDLPANMLLSCRQIRRELMDQYPSRFIIGSLSPHGVRFDPGYKKLEQTPSLASLRQVHVRIEVFRMRSGKNHRACQEIALDECLDELESQSKRLVGVLQKGARKLKGLSFDWVDDFPDQMDEESLHSAGFGFSSRAS